MKYKVFAPPLWAINTVIFLGVFVFSALLWDLFRGNSISQNPYRSLAIVGGFTCILLMKRKQKIAQLRDEKVEEKGEKL